MFQVCGDNPFACSYVICRVRSPLMRSTADCRSELCDVMNPTVQQS